MLKVLNHLTTHATLVASHSKRRSAEISQKLLAVFFCKKEIYMPTAFGFCCIGSFTTLLLVFFFFSIYGFLSFHQPITAEVLVVEGWVQDYAFESAAQEFRDGKYTWVITTGGPLQKGSQLSPYKNMAELSAAILKQKGIPEDRIIALPHPAVKINRTLASAKEVVNWFQLNKNMLSMNLISVGAHSRRSYHIFRKSLPDTIRLGIISIGDQNHDSDKWWTSSDGIRTIITETVAYIHCFFQ